MCKASGAAMQAMGHDEAETSLPSMARDLLDTGQAKEPR
jgi:hypothetical protein